MRRIRLIILIIFSFHLIHAQKHQQKYIPETDSLVLKKLEQWQYLKFGLLMHWGPYSQWGIVESWSICPEDYGWCQRKKEGTPDTYFEYVKAYEGLKETFNPESFNPGKWAGAAKKAGMRYVVFTTKHHDGFCMFDSKYTDYKIKDKNCPFHTNKNSNITKEIFEAFRKEGLWTGVYFSKPDWHNDDYWWRYFPPKDRNVNYDPDVYPEKWQRFVDYTHKQIMELLTDYGKVDILWLDGGWVAKTSKEEIKQYYSSKIDNVGTGFLKSSIVNQDIRMDDLVTKARTLQPGLIVVYRAVEGKNQNYLTPENYVPEKELPYPWESCIISSGGWSYTPDAEYMSGRDAVHLLIDIVCKGGNLLLNIAPGPDGTWDEEAYRLLGEIGKWMDINGDAIYNTRSVLPYKENEICYTKNKDSDFVYAIYMAGEYEEKMPSEILIPSFEPKKKTSVTLLGCDKPLEWKKIKSGTIIKIPVTLQNSPPCRYAWCFRIEF